MVNDDLRRLLSSVQEVASHFREPLGWRYAWSGEGPTPSLHPVCFPKEDHGMTDEETTVPPPEDLDRVDWKALVGRRVLIREARGKVKGDLAALLHKSMNMEESGKIHEAEVRFVAPESGLVLLHFPSSNGPVGSTSWTKPNIWSLVEVLPPDSPSCQAKLPWDPSLW